MAVAACDPNVPLHNVSDPRYVIDVFTLYCHHWEDIGWIGIANSHLLRTAPTSFAWIKGHDANPGNDGADAAAAQGSQMHRQNNKLFGSAAQPLAKPSSPTYHSSMGYRSPA